MRGGGEEEIKTGGGGKSGNKYRSKSMSRGTIKNMSESINKI